MSFIRSMPPRPPRPCGVLRGVAITSHSAWPRNPGRRSTYRCGISVQTSGASSPSTPSWHFGTPQLATHYTPITHAKRQWRWRPSSRALISSGRNNAAAQRKFEEVRIGIGISTGDCCVGNFGSSVRFDYSAIGDEVNVTSRLEGLSKIYGLTAVVSERTLARAKPDIPALELDIVMVKGRERATRIYTLLELLGDDVDQLTQLQLEHNKFLDAYRRQRWNDAEHTLAHCRDIGVAKLEKYYSLFASRMTALREIALPSDWDGSFTMTEK
jgi:hypothetical protein